MRGRQEAERGRKRAAQKTQKRANRCLPRRLRQESLEQRLALSGTGFDGNPYAPDLDFSGIGVQAAVVDEQITLDLFASGAVVSDLNAAGNPSGDTIRLQLDLDDNPTGATLTTDGIFRWTPSAEQMGVQEFIVLAVDEGTPPLADAEVLTIEVFAGNDAPDLADIADAQATPGELFETTVTATDPNGDSLTFVLDRDDSDATVPETATLEQLDNGSAVIRWTPNADNELTDFVFSVIVVDDGSPTLSDCEMFTVSVGADSSSTVDTVPTAFDDTYSLAPPAEPGGEMPSFDLVVGAATGVLANDVDPNGDTLTAELRTQPAHGTITFNSDGSFTYTPETGYQGSDSFTYVATDGVNESNVAVVTITGVELQNTPPQAIPDSYSVTGGGQLVTDATTGVLQNDSDADGDSLTAVAKSQPSHGTLTLSDDGSFTYTPEASYLGTDSFTYVANDGIADSSEVTVTIDVQQNHAPVATADQYQVISGDQLDVSADEGVLANDSDQNGQPLTASILSAPLYGTLTLESDGSFVYTSSSDYFGTDSFEYAASDGSLSSNSVMVVINVRENHAPVAGTEEYSVTEDSVLDVEAASGVMANDSDEDADALNVALLTGPFHGTLALEADGAFTYTPEADYFGADLFTYQASDGLLTSGSTTR